MDDRPVGTVTLLFTDIEGSTRLLQRLGEAYGGLLADHHRQMREAISTSHGVEIKTEGDAFFVIFRSATDAIAAAVEAQRRLAGHPWPGNEAVRVRMGIHTGDVSLREGEYVGIDVNRAARIAAAAHGGQVVISDATRSVSGQALPTGVRLEDLGHHRLKDIDQPEHLYQLVIDGLLAEFPPLRSLAARLRVLPDEATPFIGREQELERAADLLKSTRMLTLTGPGGTGKTRFALALTRQLEKRFEDGVAFVELAPIADPELVPATIRQALGFHEEGDRPSLDILVNQLGHSDALLTLDNFEQILPAGADVAELLARTDRLRVVVTSRATLHISGEQEFPIPPLGLPDSADASDLARLGHSEAVALFVQRARAADPDFALTSANASAVVEICRRLDGLPLAIELAASRVKLLSASALLARLERRLDLLQRGAADVGDRHATLRGAIDWSYGLLPAPEQALFRRLGIFVGGWSIDDTEAITTAAGPLGVELLDGIGSLIDNSLARRVVAEDWPRAVMLETIREFALERLGAEGELEATARAHADRYLGLAIELEPEFTRGETALDRIERDNDNVRTALRWAVAHGEINRALRAGGALWRFWHFRGHLGEGRRTLEELLTIADPARRSASRLAALIGLAGLVYWQNDFERAEALYREARDLARELGDAPAEADTLYSLSYLRGIPKDFPAAESLARQAIERYEAINDRVGAAKSRMWLGNLGVLQGRYREALAQIEEARPVLRQAGEVFLYLNSAIVLIGTLLHLGELERARGVITEMLTAQRERADMTAVGMALFATASLAALTNRAELAARILGAMDGVHERIGGQAPPPLVAVPDPRPVTEATLDPAVHRAATEAGRVLDNAGAIELGMEALAEPVSQP